MDGIGEDEDASTSNQQLHDRHFEDPLLSSEASNEHLVVPSLSLTRFYFFSIVSLSFFFLLCYSHSLSPLSCFSLSCCHLLSLVSLHLIPFSGVSLSHIHLSVHLRFSVFWLPRILSPPRFAPPSLSYSLALLVHLLSCSLSLPLSLLCLLSSLFRHTTGLHSYSLVGFPHNMNR